jgi:DNA adenine methylase
MDREASPFLKWAGGKSELLSELLPRLPPKIHAYFEPFVGAGALFWKLRELRQFKYSHINDTNRELMSAYQAIRDMPSLVVEELAMLKAEYVRDRVRTYYTVRSWKPSTPEGTAARLIFLNKTGFNGLYRVNKSGGFNVPIGRHKNPGIYIEEKIYACGRALQGTAITSLDFAKAVEDAKFGDCVYFDPPYVPLSTTANFTNYTQDGFTLEDQRRLADLFTELANFGVHVVLSNSDTPVVRKLYANHDISVVKASRRINSNASDRGLVTELIVVGRASK